MYVVVMYTNESVGKDSELVSFFNLVRLAAIKDSTFAGISESWTTVLKELIPQEKYYMRWKLKV